MGYSENGYGFQQRAERVRDINRSLAAWNNFPADTSPSIVKRRTLCLLLMGSAFLFLCPWVLTGGCVVQGFTALDWAVWSCGVSFCTCEA